MKNFLIFVIFLIQTHCLFAQSNFLEAKIITPQNDTLSGWVVYKNWRVNPKKIKFKPAIAGIERILTPDSVKRILVNNEIYVGAVFCKNSSSDKSTSLDYHNPDPVLVKDTAFLQVLTESPKKGVYLYFDGNQEYYYINSDTGLVYLEYKKYIKYDGVTKIVRENRKYISQLAAYFSDCPAVISDVSKTQYTTKSIMNVFNLYFSKYNCKKEGSEIYTKKKEPVIFTFGVLAGTTFSLLSLPDEDKSSVLPANSKITVNSATPSFCFVGGVSMELIFPRNHKRWSLFNDLMYTSYSETVLFRSEYNSANYIDKDLNTTCSFLKLSNLLRYRVLIRKFSFFPEAGISNAVSFAEKAKIVQKYHLDSGNPTIENLPKLQNHFVQSILLGAGVEYKRTCIEVRAELSSKLAPYYNVSDILFSFYFLAGYRF